MHAIAFAVKQYKALKPAEAAPAAGAAGILPVGATDFRMRMLFH